MLANKCFHRLNEQALQRCRVHFMRNALAYVPKTQETVVAAAIRQAFIQPDRETAGQVWRHFADQPRPRFGNSAG